MLFYPLFILFYSILLFSVTSIFSNPVMLFGEMFCLLPDNSERGFYPIVMSMLKHKLNYRILTIHSLTSEQESILVLLLTFPMKTLKFDIILWFLLGILFLDLLIDSKRQSLES